MWAKFFSKAVAALTIVLTLGLTTPRVVLAAPPFDDVTVTQGDYVLASGDTIDGDLLVLGGNVTIEDGATVTGDVVVFGGSTAIAGQVDGSISLIGGSLALAETANVDGDVTRTGGSFDRAAGAEVSGSVTEAPGLTNWLPALPAIINETAPPTPVADDPGRGLFGYLIAFFQAGFWILGVTVLALVVAAFWPDQTARVAATVRSAPLPSFGMGLLTGVAVPILMLVLVLLAITICLLPVSLVGWVVIGLGYAMAWLFGWIALGQLVGLQLAEALGLRNVNAVIGATAGTFLISLLGYTVSFVISFITCGGEFISWFLVPAIGVGAVALTRFGTQPYMRGVPPSAPPAEALEPPPVV